MKVTDQQILEAIDAISATQDGYVTYQALADHLGLMPSVVHRRIGLLEADGWVTRNGGRPGGIARIDQTTANVDGTLRITLDIAVVGGIPVAARLVG